MRVHPETGCTTYGFSKASYKHAVAVESFRERVTGGKPFLFCFNFRSCFGAVASKKGLMFSLKHIDRITAAIS